METVDKFADIVTVEHLLAGLGPAVKQYILRKQLKNSVEMAECCDVCYSSFEEQQEEWGKCSYLLSRCVNKSRGSC